MMFILSDGTAQFKTTQMFNLSDATVQSGATYSPDDQSMYTEEYIKLSHGLAQLSKEKEAYDNADLDRFSKRENAHGLINYLAQSSNNAVGFDEDVYNIMVEKIVFYSPDKMDFILKDGSTVTWEKTSVLEG